MLLERGLVIPVVRSILKEDDFCRVGHRMVYRVLLGLYDAGIKLNILSLSEKLRKKQELDKVGLRYVFNLAESARTIDYAQTNVNVKPLPEILQEAFEMLDVLQT